MSIIEKYRSRKGREEGLEDRAAQERKREQEAEAREAEREGMQIVTSEGTRRPTDPVKCSQCMAENPIYATLCWRCGFNLQGAHE